MWCDIDDMWIVLFMLCKGGVGMSFVVGNVVFEIVEGFKCCVLLIDVNQQFVDVVFFVSDEILLLMLLQLCVQIEWFDSVFFDVSVVYVMENFYVFVGVGDLVKVVEMCEDGFEWIFGVVVLCYDFVIFDVGVGINLLLMVVFDCSDQIQIVLQFVMLYVCVGCWLLEIFVLFGYLIDQLWLIVNCVMCVSEWICIVFEEVFGLQVVCMIFDDVEIVFEVINQGYLVLWFVCVLVVVCVLQGCVK